MKTSLDWLTDPRLRERRSESDVEAWIEAIQADAYYAGMLAGMTEAAEIVPIAGVYGDLNAKARQAILAARDAKQPASEAKG